MHLSSAQFSLSPLSPCPIKHTQQSLQFGWHWWNNRREGSGGWDKQTEDRGGGLTNESRQVTFTDVKGWRRRRGRREVKGGEDVCQLTSVHQ